MDIFDNLGIETEDLKDTNIKLAKDADEIGININYDSRKDEQHKIFYGLTEDDRNLAVNEAVVPEVYKNATFDENLIKNNIRNQYRELNGLYKVVNFKNYIENCNGILSAIRMKKIPIRSYIIGAPNGFGKTSFVVECLITLKKHGFMVAPYITLSELNTLRVEQEKRELSPLVYNKYDTYSNKEKTIVYNYNTNRGEIKTPETVVGCYSYSQYINSDCLFVALTGTNSKIVESYMLKQVLTLRSMKGLPTIVTVDTTLDIYFIDEALRMYIWDEILTRTENNYCYDRVYHVSTYKIRDGGSKLSNKGNKIDEDTGIVED